MSKKNVAPPPSAVILDDPIEPEDEGLGLSKKTTEEMAAPEPRYKHVPMVTWFPPLCPHCHSADRTPAQHVCKMVDRPIDHPITHKRYYGIKVGRTRCRRCDFKYNIRSPLVD